jgi:hypothetical protein
MESEFDLNDYESLQWWRRKSNDEEENRILADFKKEHPNCSVGQVVVKMQMNKVNSKVIVVPREGWRVDTDESDGDGAHIMADWVAANSCRKMQPVFSVTNVTPTEKIEGNWPDVLVDIYLLCRTDASVCLRRSTDAQQKGFVKLSLSNCVKVGEVNVSIDVTGQPEPDNLTCTYHLDLRHRENVLPNETAYIIMQFNVKRNPVSGIVAALPTMESFGVAKADMLVSMRERLSLFHDL